MLIFFHLNVFGQAGQGGNVQFNSFEEYFPDGSGNSSIPLFQQLSPWGHYITTPVFFNADSGVLVYKKGMFPLTDLEKLAFWTHYMDTVMKINQEVDTSILNYEDFKKLVFKKAQEFGLSVKTLESLSIHDAVLWAGKITATLQYSEEKTSYKNPDVILQKGYGYGADFASVNMAVFSLFKRMNGRLRNCYMKTMCSLELGWAWNEVISCTYANDSLFFDVTYVDATNLIEAKNYIAYMKDIGITIKREVEKKKPPVPIKLSLQDIEAVLYDFSQDTEANNYLLKHEKWLIDNILPVEK